jgi:drug/metabolite transporter (DMT)-like permease
MTEVWFLYAVAATVFAGINVFTAKIAAARNYNTKLFSACSSALAGVLGIVVGFWVEGLSELSWAMFLIALVIGGIYILGSILRMDGLRYIDAMIMLPLHKVVSPLLAIFAGFLFFSEIPGQFEWIGLGLGVLVPVMLINRGERARQSHLMKGLLFMFLSAVCGAGTAAISKFGSQEFNSVILLTGLINGLGAILSFSWFYLQQRKDLRAEIQKIWHKEYILLTMITGSTLFAGYTAMLLAFEAGGLLGIVYTIHSFYIVIPIVLAIYFYNEHWNLKKVGAIALTLLALLFLE